MNGLHSASPAGYPTDPGLLGRGPSRHRRLSAQPTLEVSPPVVRVVLCLSPVALGEYGGDASTEDDGLATDVRRSDAPLFEGWQP